MIDNTIAKLKKKIAELKDRSFFNEGTNWEDIQEVEDELCFVFPVSFTTFLCHFNGGFISLFDPKDKMDRESDAWNSNYILSLDEIVNAYRRIQYKFDDSDTAFIPFLRTSNQEYLAFKWPYEKDSVESKVYDIWHEAFPSEWETQDVYDNFEDLLEDYINNNGMIQTIG